MTNYNSLVAEKLKTLHEIQRLNKLIDLAKQNKNEIATFHDKIHLLKSELELLDFQISNKVSKEANPNINRTK